MSKLPDRPVWSEGQPLPGAPPVRATHFSVGIDSMRHESTGEYRLMPFLAMHVGEGFTSIMVLPPADLDTLIAVLQRTRTEAFGPGAS